MKNYCGTWRVLRKFDGYYVAGRGELIKAPSYEAARLIIKKLK